MAFSGSLSCHVMIGGDDTNNGGGFDPGLTSIAFDNTLSATSANTSAPVVSSVNYTFVAGDVGACVYIASGTNWRPGWYPIVSVAAGAATLDATIGHALDSWWGLSTVVGCASVASPTSGSWSIDYSRQTAAQITYTDLVIDATTNTKATSAGNPFKVNLVGNIISVTSGTGFTVQRVGIVSISGTTATFDKSLGTLSSTGGNGRLGGAFASIGSFGAISTNTGNVCWVKYNATDYSTTSTSSNVSNGVLNFQGGIATLMGLVRGYDQYPGDQTGNRPKIKWGVNAASNNLILLNSHCALENIIIDGNVANFTNPNGIGGNASGQTNILRNVKIMNCLTGFSWGLNVNDLFLYDVEITACSTAAIALTNSPQIHLYNCYIHDNTGHGITTQASSSVNPEIFADWCIFATNKNGASSSHIKNQGSGSETKLFANNCVFYNAGANGVDWSNRNQMAVLNHCHFETNGAFGLKLATGNLTSIYMRNCSFYNNTSGKYTTTSANLLSQQISGEVIPTGSVFTNAAGGDFSLNNTASAGASVRGLQKTLPGTSVVSYLDGGAAQHQDAGSAGILVHPGMSGGIRG